MLTYCVQVIPIPEVVLQQVSFKTTANPYKQTSNTAAAVLAKHLGRAYSNAFVKNRYGTWSHLYQASVLLTSMQCTEPSSYRASDRKAFVGNSHLLSLNSKAETSA